MRIGDAAERIIAGRWIAGASIMDAIERSKRLNASGIKAVINYLGEEFDDEEDVTDAVNTYLMLIREISRTHIKADISMKASQIGLRISRSKFTDNFSKIVKFADGKKVFVWLDMENANDVGATIAAYSSQLRKNHNIGICIQSYLKRSSSDIKRLLKIGAAIRLVKGAYSADPSAAYQTRQDTTINYIKLMKYLFLNSKSFVIATHDAEIISAAKKLNADNKRRVWYAMLNGIRNSYAIKLAARRENVEIYVPFGRRWVSYSYRRLKEASNLSLVLRSLFSG
jgi:proline dehydrogenase